MNQNSKNAFFLLLFTLIFVSLFSFVPEGTNFFGYKLKQVDLLMDVKKDPAGTAPQSSFMSEHPAQLQTADLLGAIVERLNASADRLHPSSTIVRVPPQGIDNVAALKNFIDAIKQTAGKKVRIAHYGDSAIEGDNISADLRKLLQAKFMGSGVGIVGFTSQDVQYRTTTKMSFSPDWKTVGLITSNQEKLPLGINGMVYVPQSGSWTKYEATGQYGVKNFTLVRVLYVSDKAFKIRYSFDDKQEMVVDVKPSAIVAEQVLTPPAKAKSVKITIVDPGKTYLYGTSLEDANGLYLDNFPLRGNSGEALRNLDIGKLREFDKLLNYKLIILNFGLNMTDAKDFNWYEAAMEKALAAFKAAFPQASILIISVQDKSEKKGSAFVTKASVPLLVSAQQKIAQKSGSAFWNLFEAMGGANSMSTWVNQGFATKDYTHVNLSGAKKIAEMLSDAILTAYNNSK